MAGSYSPLEYRDKDDWRVPHPRYGVKYLAPDVTQDDLRAKRRVDVPLLVGFLLIAAITFCWVWALYVVLRWGIHVFV